MTDVGEPSRSRATDTQTDQEYLPTSFPPSGAAAAGPAACVGRSVGGWAVVYLGNSSDAEANGDEACRRNCPSVRAKCQSSCQRQ